MAMGLSSANLSFRGFNQRIANKVLVLVDGRPEYQDFLGVTLWPLLPVGLEEIDRVEVIRGPGSALYGANAMLGVVNIVTRAPGTGPGAEASGLWGNGNVGGGSFVASGGGRLRYRASVGYLQGDKYSRDYGDDRVDVASNVAAADAVGMRGVLVDEDPTDAVATVRRWAGLA
jgi:iron complex outermembrane receptor protein